MRRDGILNIDEKMKHRRALLGDDVLLLVPRHRVLLRASGDILHVVGVAGVSDEKVRRRRERDGSRRNRERIFDDDDDDVVVRE